MLLTNLLLLILGNICFVYGCVNVCNLKSAVECPEDTTDSSSSALRLFFLSASKTLYYTRNHSCQNRTILELSGKTGVTALDYSAKRDRLYWTSPRLGYWTKNSRVQRIQWDYRYACANGNNAPWNDKTREDNEKDGLERCCDNVVKSYDKKRKTKVVREKDNWNPRSLAVDDVGRKIYIVDTGDRSVKVYSSRGKNGATVFERESLIPLEVALDSSEGLMFVLAVNTELRVIQIYRANMDGTSPDLLDDNDEDLGLFFVRSKVGFTVDTLKKRIYFSNVKKGIIESIDYKGNGRQIVVKAKYPTSISIHNQTLYWSDSRFDATAMFMCDEEKCHVQTCKLNTIGICDESSVANFIEIPGQNIGIHEVKPIDPRLQPTVSNPCENDNGGCEHHCLLKSPVEDGQSLGFRCVCRDGYRLTADHKNCTRDEVTHVYDDFYMSKGMNFTDLWNTPAKDDIFPISRNLLFRLFYERRNAVLYKAPFRFIRVSESGKELVEQQLAPADALNANPQLNRVLSEFELERLANQSVTLRSYPKEVIASAISYDWITGNVYFVKSTSADDEQGELIVVRYRPPKWSKKKNHCKKRRNKKGSKYTSSSDYSLGNIQIPVSIAVHPYDGYVFVNLRNGSILRLNSDGSDRLLFSNVNNSLALTVDLSDDKIYWLDSDGYINHANFNGSESKQLLKSRSNTESIYVYDKWLYTRSETDNLVFRFDKLTGEEAGSLKIGTEELYRESIGVKVSARDARYVDKSHPCADDNGDCEVFCFGVPVEGNGDSELRRQCGCGINRKLLADGLACDDGGDDV